MRAWKPRPGGIFSGEFSPRPEFLCGATGTGNEGRGPAQKSPLARQFMADPGRYDEFASLLQEASPRILAYLDAMLLNWNDAGRRVPGVVHRSVAEVRRVSGRDELRGLGDADRAEQGDALSADAGAAGRVCGGPNSKTRCWPPWPTARQPGRTTRWPPCRAAWASFPTATGSSSSFATATGSPCGRWPPTSAASPQSVHNSLRRIRTTLLECVERTMKQEGRR